MSACLLAVYVSLSVGSVRQLSVGSVRQPVCGQFLSTFLWTVSVCLSVGSVFQPVCGQYLSDCL
ncbi:hypothetical protein DPMN_004481 [Dreissena polymorpha]|uniref:Uncharacterized protein n=1 Tax=Dreissena polymorpha TaxID=45954 RepID=A0A9D4MRD5_DREPO|nr:hypothetical protein DPMN_004481 [Dreissena polymorpha]